MTSKAASPKNQTAAMAAGSRAISTCTMILEMVSPPRMCGELLTTSFVASGS